MHILADGPLFQDGELRFTDFSRESQVEIAKIFRDLLLLAGRILARRERACGAGRRWTPERAHRHPSAREGAGHRAWGWAEAPEAG